MRFVGLASLVLATVLGASNASAGFIPIDNFDGTPVGHFTTRSVTGLLTSGSNFNSTVPGAAYLESNSGTLFLNYTLPSLYVGGYASLKLEGIANINAAETVNVTAFVNGSAIGTQALAAGDLVFDGGVGPVTITSLQFQFSSIDTFNFSVNSLQAVPEPTTLALIGLVGAGGGVAGWRRRRAAKA